MFRTTTLLTLAACSALGFVVACSSDEPAPPGPGAGGGGVGGAGVGGSIELIPSSLPELDVTSTCVPLLDGESLGAVSPEGHAWIVAEGEGGVAVRVADPFDDSVSSVTTYDVGTVKQLQAWSEDDATILTDQGLWRIVDGARIQIETSADASTLESFCGTFDEAGLAVGGGTVYELREGSWWSWSELSSSDLAPQRVVDVDGDCVAGSNFTAVVGEDGSLLQLGASSYYPDVQHAPEAPVASTTNLLAALDGDLLFLGPAPWVPRQFEGNAPTSMAAAGGYLWLWRGDRVVRYDGTTFTELATLPSASVAKVVPHAGGAWIAGDGEVCHVATGPQIRVAGIRPHLQSLEETHTIVVSSSDGEDVTVTLDGESVSTTDVDGDTTAEVTLPSIGWHHLTLTSGDASRVIPIKLVPSVERSWETDILPLFTDHCAGGTCHSEESEAAPTLETYENWVGLAATINNRVIIAGTMPPASTIPPEWDDKKGIIAEWLEGGMLP